MHRSEDSSNVDDVVQQAEAKIAKEERTRKFWPRFWLVMGILPFALPLLCYGCIRVVNPNAGAAKIRISQETTHITGPLDADGYVDYVAAINLRYGEGVTPENNAAVLILQAVGPPEGLTDITRGDFYAQLGIEPLDPHGQYFVSWEEFSTQHPDKLPPEMPASDEWLDSVEPTEDDTAAFNDAMNQAAADRDWETFHQLLHEHLQSEPRLSSEIFDVQMSVAMHWPWNESDFPAVAEWLEMNDAAFDLSVRASQRSRFFIPLYTEKEALRLFDASFDPTINEVRSLARGLAIRAMYRLRSGDVEGAWEDVLAIHRLARLTGQDPTIIGALVAYAVEGIAIQIGSQMTAADLPPEMFAHMREDLEALPAIADIADKLDGSERLSFLDCTISVARQGGMSDLEVSDGAVTFGDRWNDTLVNWNSILSDANEYYDSTVAAARRGDEKQVNKLEEELEALMAEADDPLFQAQSLVSGSARTKLMKARLYSLLMPAVNSAFSAQDRMEAIVKTARLSLAVAEYRQRHGDLPNSLSDLVPEIIAEIPPDEFSGVSFAYRITDDGFMVYTMGENAQDDGGPGNWEDVSYDAMDFGVIVPPKFDADEVFGY